MKGFKTILFNIIGLILVVLVSLTKKSSINEEI